jgi:hypothetical protein
MVPRRCGLNMNFHALERRRPNGVAGAFRRNRGTPATGVLRAIGVNLHRELGFVWREVERGGQHTACNSSPGEAVSFRKRPEAGVHAAWQLQRQGPRETVPSSVRGSQGPKTFHPRFRWQPPSRRRRFEIAEAQFQMRKTVNQPNVPPDPDHPKAGQDVSKKVVAEESEEFLPAPVTDEQRRIAEAWQRPPGQNSG